MKNGARPRGDSADLYSGQGDDLELLRDEALRHVERVPLARDEHALHLEVPITHDRDPHGAGAAVPGGDHLDPGAPTPPARVGLDNLDEATEGLLPLLLPLVLVALQLDGLIDDGQLHVLLQRVTGNLYHLYEDS